MPGLMTTSTLSITLKVPAEQAGQRLDQALAALLPDYSRSRLKAWIDAGEVLVDGAVLRPRDKVSGGETVSIAATLVEETDAVAQAIPLELVHEDRHVFVINKPAGLVVHPGAGNPDQTLQNALLALDSKLAALPRAGIIHRLDKDTSGLLVVAKTLEAQTALVRQLQARTVSRRYLAVVMGAAPDSGTVETPIGRHPTQRTRMATVATGKPAVTHYRTLRRGDGWTLVECRLETGRTHQIRVHMDAIGHPLLGDPVYGPRRAPALLAQRIGDFARQALHAWRLGLVHPQTGLPMSWEAPPPADFQELLARLEAAA
jgi:23S rRNA pseudouridine1911/1915/1917 synthase